MFFFAALLVAAPRSFAQASTNTLLVLAPPDGEMSPTFWEQHGTAMLLGGVTLIALAGLILWKRFLPRAAVVLPPEVLAREALIKLLGQPEDGKLLSEVSQILRRYVAARFDLPGDELTTAEFIHALARLDEVDGQLREPISGFLRECDVRKFSPAKTATPLNAVNRALEFIAQAEPQLGAQLQK